MQQTIDIRPADIFRLQFHVHSRSIGAIAVALVLALSLMGDLRSELLTNPGMTMLLALWAACLMLYIVLVFLLCMLNPNWRKGRLGKHVIALSEEGVTESTEFNTMLIHWHAIEDVRFVYGWILLKWAGEAFTIPAHSFASQSEWRAFGERMIELWKQGNDVPSRQ